MFAAECKQAGIEEGSIIVAANGEIYNYKELYELLKKEGVPYEPNTGSDCEVLIPLYVKFGLEKACSLLRGARRPNSLKIDKETTHVIVR